MRHHALSTGVVGGRGHRAAEARPARGSRTARLRRALPRLSVFVVEYLLLLPIGAVFALVWANARPEDYFQFAYAIRFAVNDVAMVFFFGFITKEVVEAMAPGGLFHPWRRTVLPVAAAAGGIVISILAYLLLVQRFDEPLLAQAWPSVFGTDLALAYFLTRIIFGRHPAVPFVLLMGIAANGLGFVVLALFYPARDLHLGEAAVFMTAAVAAAAGLRLYRVKSFWPYILVGGTLSWLALYRGGLHPALALVPIIPFLPHAARDPGFFVDPSPGAHDALNRFELWCRFPAQAALFLFGLVNAGVPVRALEQGAWALPIATLAGRPIGILLVVALATAAGMHRPRHIGWRELTVVGVISGVGFTLALFFASATLAPGQLLSETRMGALASTGGVALAFALARLLGAGRFAPPAGTRVAH